MAKGEELRKMSLSNNISTRNYLEHRAVSSETPSDPFFIKINKTSPTPLK